MPAPKINRIVARKPADAKPAPAKGAAAEKEKKALDTLHKELWGAITEKDEDRARMELWQIANNALQMAMCYALLAAEAGRATDELA